VGCGRAAATEAADWAYQRFGVHMSDIKALVALTVGVDRVRCRWQDVRPAFRLGCEGRASCANAVDNSPVRQGGNGPAWLSTLAPLTGEDDDYND
jgi:hypothetical protein